MTPIQGLADLQATLRSLPAKLRRRALRNALAAGARIVRDAARAGAPVLSPAARAVQLGHRKPGTLRRAISVRTSKQARRAGDVAVFVNVRPAQGARYRTTSTRSAFGVRQSRTLVRASQRGAKSPNDPFYWRFIEFGTRSIRAQPFLRQAAAKLDQALQAFARTLGPQIAKLNTQPKADL